MKKSGMLMVLIFCSFLLAAAVENADKPLKGDWDFKPESIWKVSSAGKELLAVPAQIQVSDDGTVYVHDFRQGKSFIFDSKGKFLKAFGTRGEGPGEVKRHLILLLAGDNVIAGDSSRIHYFKKNGEYIKSVANNLFARQPHVFLNEDEFISAPVSIVSLPGNKGKIMHINLKSGEQKFIKEFSVFKGGVVKKGGRIMTGVVVGLTPMMTIGFHNDKLYYGSNDSYVINVAQLDGKIINTFSVKREKQKLSKEDKKKHFEMLSRNVPPDRFKAMMDSLPNELTYFNNIHIVNGHIYVSAGGFGRQRDSQQIDIFSLDGKYLYRVNVVFKDFKIRGTELIIKNGYLCVLLDNKNGEAVIAKYKITMPKP